jgi:hypothetical protein
MTWFVFVLRPLTPGIRYTSQLIHVVRTVNAHDLGEAVPVKQQRILGWLGLLSRLRLEVLLRDDTFTDLRQPLDLDVRDGTLELLEAFIDTVRVLLGGL